MLMNFRKNILSNVTKQSYLMLLIAILFVACTDYEAMIDEDYEEREYAQQLSSSSAKLSSISSSSIKNVIESSSSKENISSSSEKQVVSSCSEGAVSSSSKKGEKSSSSQNAKSSSSVLLLSSSITPVSSSSRKNESSSSSKNEQSSSSILSSSSGKASWAYLNPAISYGEITDDRDGQVYKIVKIGDQTWIAENLNYETSNYSNCYKNIDANCTKFGRIYTWSAAMIACPSDWRLPDKGDWNDLITYVGGASIAGKKLKSIIGWNSNGNGTDAFGFSAYPAGGLSGGYYDEGKNVLFWSATENESGSGAFDLDLYYMDDDADLIENDKGSRYSVRCIKNVFPKSSSSISSSSSSKALWAYLNPAVSYGEIVDDRDGQVYKTVEIGEQTWMAENLNYEIEPYNLNYDVVQSFCYNDSAKYCEKYGRLYTWDAAKRACPTNWRLPTNDEFEKLIAAVGGESIAGKMLRAFGDNSCCVGTNDYGFSGLPAGIWDDYEDKYVSEGLSTNFWSSTKYDDKQAYYMMLWEASAYAYLDDPSEINRLDFYKNHGKSVRCIKK